MSMRAETSEELKGFLARIESLEADRKGLADDIRLVYAEAKARGFDPKTIRKMVIRRRKDPTELAEEDTLLDNYMHAAGMIDKNPLAAAVGVLARDALGRDEVIDAFKQLVPMHGEIIARVGGDPLRLWRGEDGIARVEPYVEPAAAPAEKPGKGLKKSATVLSIVPASVTPIKPPADVDAGSKDDEPVE